MSIILHWFRLLASHFFSSARKSNQKVPPQSHLPYGYPCIVNNFKIIYYHELLIAAPLPGRFDYELHPCNSPNGPCIACLNSLHANLSHPCSTKLNLPSLANLPYRSTIHGKRQRGTIINPKQHTVVYSLESKLRGVSKKHWI